MSKIFLFYKNNVPVPAVALKRVCVLYADKICQDILARDDFNFPLSSFAFWWGHRSSAP